MFLIPLDDPTSSTRSRPMNCPGKNALFGDATLRSYRELRLQRICEAGTRSTRNEVRRRRLQGAEPASLKASPDRRVAHLLTAEQIPGRKLEG